MYRFFKKKLWAHLLNDKGMALVTVLVVSTVLAMVGNSFLSSVGMEAGLANEMVEQEQAFYVAESGLNYARRRLKNGCDWISGDWSETINGPVSGGSITVSFSGYDPETQTATVTSTSSYKSYSKTVTLNVKALKISPFQMGLCGCEKVDIKSGLVNSYDSMLGFYGNGNISSNGDTDSNGNMLLGSAAIKGSVTAGGNLTGNSDSLVTGSAELGGNDDGMNGTVTWEVGIAINAVKMKVCTHD